MSYSIAVRIKHVTDDGIVNAEIEIPEYATSGLPPEGEYRINGHLYTGPGEAGDSVGVVTPHGAINGYALTPQATEVARADARVKYAANAETYAERARRERGARP